MKRSIFEYFNYFLIFLMVIAATKSLELFLPYLVLWLMYTFINMKLDEESYAKKVILVAFIALVTAYFVRPLILFDGLWSFLYYKLGTISEEDVINSLWSSIIFTAFLVLSAYLVLVNSNKEREEQEPNWDLRNKFVSVSLFFLFFMGMRFFLTAVLGIGVKGETTDSSYAFLYKLFPRDLPFIILMLFVVHKKETMSLIRLRLSWVLLIFASITVLITGSKAFVFILGVVYLFLLLFKNTKIRLSVMIKLISIGLIIVPASFLISGYIKHGEGHSFFFYVKEDLSTFTAIQNLAMYEVTSRLNGTDGNIGINYLQKYDYLTYEKLEKNNAFVPVVLRTIETVVPKVDLTKTFSSGKAIGVYLTKHDKSVSHAGAVGIIAALKLMGIDEWLSGTLTGIIVAYLFLLVLKIRGFDYQFIVFYSLSFFLIQTVMSGNFDRAVGDLFIKGVVLIFYRNIISLISQGIFRDISQKSISN
jgi:hypothetical protein